MNRRKVASELVMVAKELVAAEEIDVDELPPDRLALAKKIRMKPVAAWESIHGYVMILSGRMAARLDASDLKRLASDENFRWISPGDRKSFTIGC